MNIISIHQPSFIPWIGFFSKIALSNQFVILDHVQISKKSYENRVKIKSQRGPIWLTVPIHRKVSVNQSIKDTLIDNSSSWNTHMVRVIQNAYSKAPYFDKYWLTLENILIKKWNWLLELNIALLEHICSILSISFALVFSSAMELGSEKGSNLNLAIVKNMNGSVYLSGEMGKDYLLEHDFNQQNIIIKYQHNNYPTYIQRWGDFEHGLSIIDMLFNCGEESVKDVLHIKKAEFNIMLKKNEN